MVSALLILRSRGVWPGPSPSLLEKEREEEDTISALLILRSGGVLPRSPSIPLLEGKRGGSHGLCPSDLERWRSVAMVTHIPLVERRREESHGLCLFPIASLF